MLGDGISGIDLSCCCSHMSGTLRVCVCVGGGGGGGGGGGACPTSPSILSQIMHSSCIILSLSQEFNLLTYSLEYGVTTMYISLNFHY